MADVVITPASGLIDFQNTSGISSATIQLNGSGDLIIGAAAGDIQIGDTSSDIFVGDGVNNVDIVFEQDGEVRGETGVTVTLGQSDSYIKVNAGLKDSNGVVGAAGSVLSSDGSLVEWVTPQSGAQGATGSAGAQGATGSTGAQGAAGSNGENGAQGSTGAQGATGSAGAQGATGSTGAQGAAGSNGENGAQGATGSTGAQGAAGSNGDDGAQGATGSTGAQGAAGSNGAQGATGSTGAQGDDGAQGAAGSNGAQGAAGSAGAQGDDGAQGATGPVAGSANQVVYKNSSNSAAGSDSFQYLGSSSGIGTVGIGTIIDIVHYDNQNDGTLSFEGSAGQLFSITNNLTSGSIFSVNDVSGIPSIDVDADGTVQLAPYGSTENVGVGTTNPTQKLDVSGDVRIRGGIYDSNDHVGTAGSVLSSTGSGWNWVTAQSGAQGAAGAQGATGSTGAQGAAGSNGDDGAQGATGSTGAQGDDGAQGATGAQGSAGAASSRSVNRTVATSGQTTITGLTYTAGYADVYLNGSKLDSTEYTASNGTSVVLTTGASTGDIIEVVAHDIDSTTNTISFTVTDEGSDATCFPVFVTGATGSQSPKTDASALTYDSSSGLLSATTFAGKVDLSGLLKEGVNITAGKLSDNTNIDLANGMVHLFTTAETTTSTPNIRVDGSTSLDSSMSTGEGITVVLITTAAAAGYSAQLTIDSGAVTEEWLGGSAPSAGGSGGYDVYSYNIIKTGSATFVVLANLVNFA